MKRKNKLRNLFLLSAATLSLSYPFGEQFLFNEPAISARDLKETILKPTLASNGQSLVFEDVEELDQVAEAVLPILSRPKFNKWSFLRYYLAFGGSVILVIAALISHESQGSY